MIDNEKVQFKLWIAEMNERLTLLRLEGHIHAVDLEIMQSKAVTPFHIWKHEQISRGE